jgi:hypothetical protein
MVRAIDHQKQYFSRTFLKAVISHVHWANSTCDGRNIGANDDNYLTFSTISAKQKRELQ